MLDRLPAQPLQRQLEKAANPFGHQENDQQEDEPVEEVAELRQGRHELRERRQHHRAEERAEDAAAPADDDADEEEEADLEDEGVGRDVALQRGEQRAPCPGRHPAEGEDGELLAKQRDADRGRRDLAVAHGEECAAPHQAGHVPGEPGDDGGHGEDQPVEAVRGGEGRPEARDGQPHAAAGKIAEGEHKLGDDQGEGQRDEREVEAGQAQGGKAEEEADQAAQRTRPRAGTASDRRRACRPGSRTHRPRSPAGRHARSRAGR